MRTRVNVVRLGGEGVSSTWEGAGASPEAVECTGAFSSLPSFLSPPSHPPLFLPPFLPRFLSSFLPFCWVLEDYFDYILGLLT